MSNRTGTNTRKRRTQLRATALAAREPRTIPRSWLNAVIGFFLLAPAWVTTQTFFTCFVHAAVHHGFWRTTEFMYFCGGAVLWAVLFVSLPKPLVIYVFGHELTHVIWVWLLGGQVSGFRVSRKGGHIVTDTHTFWIALAPYFFPIYSVMVIAGWGITSIFLNLEPYRPWLYAIIGVTWAFHVSFTLWMIPKGQSDITHHGTFFSLVIIYLMNLLVLTIFLILASPHVTWGLFTDEWLGNAHAFAAWVLTAAWRAREALAAMR
jgi:hypothetical protein